MFEAAVQKPLGINRRLKQINSDKQAVMEFKKIIPDHIKALGGLRESAGGRIADYSFAYLYIHRNVYNFRVAFEPFPCAAGRTPDGFDFFMPLVEPDMQNSSIITEAVGDIGAIFPVHEDKVHIFENAASRIEVNRDDSDYIYSIDKLKDYRGRKLHGQKNLLNRFFKNYSFTVLPLSHDNTKDVMAILEKWQADSALSRDSTDYNYCSEAVLLGDEIGLSGYIFYVEGEPAGFISGEIRNSDTFTVFFSKGIKTVKGIYQFMFNYAARAMPDEIKFFNFEQDMGIEGLRKFKLSYNPDYLLDKYRIIL